MTRRPADDDDDDDCGSVEDCVDTDLGVNSVNSVEKLGPQPPIRCGVEDSRMDKDCIEKLGRQLLVRFNVETDHVGKLGR